MGCTRNKTQQLGQAAQHFHLCGTACGRFVFATTAPQFFQQGHGAACRLAHVKLTKASELGHFCGTGHANHGIAVHAACAQVVQDGQKVIFKEEHAAKHNVGRGNIGFAFGNEGIIACVLRRGVKTPSQAWKIALQLRIGAIERTRKVRVHGDHHHFDGGGITYVQLRTVSSKL